MGTEDSCICGICQINSLLSGCRMGMLNFTLLQDKGDFLNEISENLLEKNGKA